MLKRLKRKPAMVADPVPSRYYTSIHDLPLRRFIVCLCDNDLQSLVIEGEVSPEVLKHAWEAMYQDYTDEIFTENEYAMLQIVRKTTLLQFNITKTQAIMLYLSYRHDEEMVSLLLQLGACDSRYPDTPVLQDSWRKRILGRVKRWQTEYDQEAKTLEQFKDTHQGVGQKATREGFQKFIVQIEKYMGFTIDENVTTVGRFVAMVKDLQRHITQQNKSKK